MPGSSNDIGQPYAMDDWTPARPAGMPKYDFWTDYSEMKREAERIIELGHFRFVALYERGDGEYGWVEREVVTNE